MIRHSGTYDAKLRPRPRATAAPATFARFPDLQTCLTRAYLLEKSRQALNTEADKAGSAKLFFHLASLQRQAADLSLGVDDFLASLADHARSMTRADAAAVALLQDESVVCRARAGSNAPTLGTCINLDSSFSGQCFRGREILCCDDAESDSRVNPDLCRVAGIRSLLAAPVERNHHAIGIVEVFSASRARFGPAEARVIELLAGLVTDALLVRGLPGPPARREPIAAAAAVVLPAALTPIQVEAHEQEIPPEVAVAGEPVKADRETAVVKPAPPRSLSWLAIAALSLSCVALIVIGHQRSRGASVSTPPAMVMREPEPTIRVVASPLSPTVATGPGTLQGVKYSSHPDFTTVAIELSGPVKVKTEQLSNPDRIYFDLVETRVSPKVTDALNTKNIPVGDRLVNRVRVAQKSEDVARVVIDLNRECEYAYVMSETPPFRLMVELHARDKSNGALMAAELTTPAVPRPPITPGQAPSAAAIRPLKIVIDPGHGGWDTGTVGPSGLQEKELVLDVAERLSKLLKARLGAETVLTRKDDTFIPLASRPALANSVGADLFVSIHGNSSSTKDVRGVETFYVEPAAYKGAAPGSPLLAVIASRHFAAVLQRALYASLSNADPLVQNRGVKAAPLSVLVAPKMPSVLTEISFVSSSYDEQKLRRPEYRDTIAEALFQGIKTYAARPATTTQVARGQ